MTTHIRGVRDRLDATHNLQRCPRCALLFVEPEALLGVCGDGVVLDLRCGNCAWRDTVIAHSDAFDQLDRDLDAATAAMMADRRKLDYEAVASEFDVFIGALHAGAVWPEDFAV